MTSDDPTTTNAEGRGPRARAAEEEPRARAAEEEPRARAAEEAAYAKRHAAGKVIVGARTGGIAPELVERALVESVRVDVTIDRIALRESLEAQGVPRDTAWQIALSASILDDSVSLMTRDELSRRSV